MKTPSRTTTFGAAAGGAYALSTIPGLPSWLTISFQAGAALSMFLLGYSSTDCPPNCPGTDENGNLKPRVRPLRLPIAGLGCLALATVLAVGCISANPKAGPTAPTEPAYIVNPALDAYSNSAVQVATTAGQVTGTGPLLPAAASTAFALMAALSGLWARHKSQVADALASGVAKTGPLAVRTVLDSAADTTKFAAVAEALNQHLAAGNAPGNTPAPAASSKDT